MGPYKNTVYRVTYNGLNRKRQIIDQHLDELHTIHMEMIEQALALSDLRQAKEIIQYIMEKS